MIVNATFILVYNLKFAILDETMFNSYAMVNSVGTFVHWMFCYTYLKLTIEAKYMFDRRIYTNDPGYYKR